MSSMRRLLALTLLLASLACTKGASDGGPPARETLENGVVVVRYDDLSGTPPVTAAVDLTIGVMEGEPFEVFGDVRGVDADADGTIYVLDSQAAEIRAFDASGMFLRRVAGEGEGPGELLRANGILLRDSILWVQDHARWQMIALRPEGGELLRVPMPVLSYGYIWSGTVDLGGVHWRLDLMTDEEPVWPPPTGLQEGVGQEYMIRFDPATDRRDSIYVGERAYRTHSAESDGGGYAHRGIPFFARPSTVVDPDGGFWRTEGARYSVARLDARGDTTLLIEVSEEPAPVTQEDRTEYVDARSEDAGPLDLRALEAVADLMPDEKPLLAGLVVDDGGRLWVERSTPAGEPPRYDVFDRQGEFLGAVRLGFEPALGVPIWVRHGAIYSVVRDELDVPRVVRAPLPAFRAD